MSSKEERLSALREEISALEAQIEQAEIWSDKVRSLESFSPEEKIELFGQLYERAQTYLEESMETGFRPKDGKYYLFEAVMETMLGVQVWELLRSIGG